MLIDIHTHHLRAFDKNTIVVLNQTQRDNFFETVSSDEKYFSFKTFGLHPWYLDRNKYALGLEKLETLLRDNKIIAIGECGLDKLRGTSLDVQIKIFEAQLQLAMQYQKPVIIHCVRAFNELIAIVKKKSLTPTFKLEKTSVPSIIHGFNNNGNVLQSLLDAGFYISLGAAILNVQNEKPWREKINKIPIDKLFFETDDSDESIERIYNRAAQLLKMPVQVLEKQIENNFNRLLPIKSRS